MPEGETLPVEVTYSEIAETYHISPLDVAGWPAFEIHRYTAILNAKRAGENYRMELEKAKAKRG